MNNTTITNTITNTNTNTIISTKVNDLLATMFTIALIIIYLPQLAKIRRTKSSVGISTWYMFLGHTAALLTAVNSLIFYINGWSECSGFINCVEEFVGYGLIVVQWILFFIMYVMFIIYLHRPDDLVKPALLNQGVSRSEFNRGLFGLSIVISLVALTITILSLYKNEWHYRIDDKNNGLTVWSSILEIIILVFFLLHYIPQIYECWRIKSPGSISLITLGIMCPGTFAWTAYLALQGDFTNNKDTSNPMVWIPYLIVGVMQGVLLGMGIYYDRKNKRMIQLDLETQAFFDNGSSGDLSIGGPIHKIVIY
jgi:uncharacterized protein with PQ loop repeat